MKGDSIPINRIYGDPQLLALNNRVQYIKSRQKNLRIPFTTLARTQPSHNNTSHSTQKSHKFISSNVATESPQRFRQPSPFPKESKERLRHMRSLQYLQAKQNSQKYKARITQSREKELLLKRIKRKKILMEEQQGRAKLQAFEEDKIRCIRNTKSNRDLVNDKLEWKRIQLKRQLVQEQTRSLHVYQQALSYKSELMQKIKDVLRENR